MTCFIWFAKVTTLPAHCTIQHLSVELSVKYRSKPLKKIYLSGEYLRDSRELSYEFKGTSYKPIAQYLLHTEGNQRQLMNLKKSNF